jgi:hypothetical protein
MSRQAVVQRSSLQPCERRDRRSNDEPIQQHRDRPLARFEHSAGDGCHLGPAHLAQDLEWWLRCADALTGLADDSAFSPHASGIDARSSTHPPARRSTEEDGANGCGGRRIANPQLAEDEEICVRISDGSASECESRGEACRIERRLEMKRPCRPPHADVDDPQLSSDVRSHH